MRSELENALLENPVVPKAKVPKPNNPSPAKASRGSPSSGRVPLPAASGRVSSPAASGRVPSPAASGRVPSPAASGKVPSPAAADYGKQGLGGDKYGRFFGYAQDVFHIKRIGPLVAVEGRGTFDRRQVLRRAGGKWDANAKSWTFTDTQRNCVMIQEIMSAPPPIIEEEEPFVARKPRRRERVDVPHVIYESLVDGAHRIREKPVGAQERLAVLSNLRSLQELLKLAVEAWEENADIAEDFDEADWFDGMTSFEEERELADQHTGKLLFVLHFLGVDINRFGIKPDEHPKDDDNEENWVSNIHAIDDLDYRQLMNCNLAFLL